MSYIDVIHQTVRVNAFYFHVIPLINYSVAFSVSNIYWNFMHELVPWFNLQRSNVHESVKTIHGNCAIRYFVTKYCGQISIIRVVLFHQNRFDSRALYLHDLFVDGSAWHVSLMELYVGMDCLRNKYLAFFSKDHFTHKMVITSFHRIKMIEVTLIIAGMKNSNE